MSNFIRRPTDFRALYAALYLTGFLGSTVCAHETSRLLKGGDSINLSGRQAMLRNLDTLSLIESEYTKRFRFDSFENPKLKELRERHRLDEVVAPGRDEFERQVLLMDWTHRQFKKFGRPSTNCHGALAILNAVGEGLSGYREAACRYEERGVRLAHENAHHQRSGQQSGRLAATSHCWRGNRHP